jgi:hypothetical protein
MIVESILQIIKSEYKKIMTRDLRHICSYSINSPFELSYWVVHKYEKKVAVDVKFQDLAFSVEIVILLPASRAIVLFIKTIDAVSPNKV